MSLPDTEPFDDQEFLQLLARIESAETSVLRAEPADVLRLVHLGGKLMTEVIRLRQSERGARQRLSLLEQGQTLLPLPLSTETNQSTTPSHAH